MAAHTAKRYDVWKRSGRHEIYRNGQHVGHHPVCGYKVVVHGRCTRLAGTALAAHAIAEIELGIQPQRRKFVLTAEEYDEHISALQGNLDALMDRFPFTPEEAAHVDATNARYASVIEAGRESTRRALMNVSPYEYVTWDPRPRSRPDFAEPAEEALTPRM